MHIPYSEDGEEIVETCAQASRHTIAYNSTGTRKGCSPVGSYFCFGPHFSSRNRGRSKDLWLLGWGARFVFAL